MAAILVLLIIPVLSASPTVVRTPPFRHGSTYSYASWANGNCSKGTGSGSASAHLNNGTAGYHLCALVGKTKVTVWSRASVGFWIPLKVHSNGTHSIYVSWKLNATVGLATTSGYLFILDATNGSVLGWSNIAIGRGPGNSSMSWTGALSAGHPYLAKTYFIGAVASFCSPGGCTVIPSVGSRVGSLMWVKII